MKVQFFIFFTCFYLWSVKTASNFPEKGIFMPTNYKPKSGDWID